MSLSERKFSRVIPVYACVQNGAVTQQTFTVQLQQLQFEADFVILRQASLLPSVAPANYDTYVLQSSMDGQVFAVFSGSGTQVTPLTTIPLRRPLNNIDFVLWEITSTGKLVIPVNLPQDTYLTLILEFVQLKT